MCKEESYIYLLPISSKHKEIFMFIVQSFNSPQLFCFCVGVLNVSIIQVSARGDSRGQDSDTQSDLNWAASSNQITRTRHQLARHWDPIHS